MKNYICGNSISKIIDKFIQFLFLVGKYSIDLEPLFKKQEELHGKSLYENAVVYMDGIDSKSAALLTHVSMLIAAVSIMMTVFEDPETRTLLLIEIAIYIFIAIGLLRCIDILDTKNTNTKNDDRYKKSLLEEVSIRLSVYQRCRILTIIATIAFFVGVIYKVDLSNLT